jgi:hypothetical protein
MAVLTTNWTPRARVSPEKESVVTEGDGATGGDASAESTPSSSGQSAGSSAHAAKPLVIYVTSGETGEGFDKIEKVVLVDDKIAVGLKFFETVKMTPEEAAKDPALAEKGKESPRFLFVSADYKVLEVIEGSKVSVGGFYKALSALAKKTLVGDFDGNVKDIKAIMTEWDKIEKQKAVLEEKKTREDKPTPADLKKMEKEEKELAERKAKADKEHEKLMGLALKPIEGATTT